MCARLLVLLSHLLAAPAFSREETEPLPPERAKSVAVLEISSAKGVPGPTLERVIEAAGEGFIAQGYHVVLPAEVRAIHLKGRLKPSVCNDAPGCLAKEGRVVGAAYVAKLSVARGGNGYWVKLMVVDTAEAKIVAKGLSLARRGKTTIFERAIKSQVARVTAVLDGHIAKKRALTSAGSEPARAESAPAPITTSLERPPAVVEAPATLAEAQAAVAAVAEGEAPVADKPTVAPAQSAAEALSLQARARLHMHDIEYELAIPLLLRALETPTLTPRQKAEISADLGLCQASLGDASTAGASFDSALGADPLYDLPAGTSPKIRRLFETIRARRAEAAPRSPARLVALESPSGAGVRAVDYLLGSIALAGLGAGIGAGIVSSRAADDLKGGLHDRPVVDRLKSRQRTWGVVSVVAYSVAGAAAAVELVKVIFLNGRSEAPAKFTVSGSISGSGAAASVRVSF